MAKGNKAKGFKERPEVAAEREARSYPCCSYCRDYIHQLQAQVKLQSEEIKYLDSKVKMYVDAVAITHTAPAEGGPATDGFTGNSFCNGD